MTCQTPLSMGVSRQECWDLPDLGVKPGSPRIEAETSLVLKPNNNNNNPQVFYFFPFIFISWRLITL